MRVDHSYTLGWDRADTVVEERQRLNDAVKHHQRDRNRAPSEPSGKLLFVIPESR